MRDRDRALLQTGHSHWNFPSRAGRIATLNRAIDERRLRVAQQGGILGAAFLRVDALGEEIWIEGWVRGEREQFAVVRIERDDRAAPRRRVAQLCFGRLLQVEINRRDQILTRLRLDPFKFRLNVSARIYDHFAIAVAPAQSFVINFLQTFLPDDVAGLQSARTSVIARQLRRTDLADVTEHVREQSMLRIMPLRL